MSLAETGVFLPPDAADLLKQVWVHLEHLGEIGPYTGRRSFRHLGGQQVPVLAEVLCGCGKLLIHSELFPIVADPGANLIVRILLSHCQGQGLQYVVEPPFVAGSGLLERDFLTAGAVDPMEHLHTARPVKGRISAHGSSQHLGLNVSEEATHADRKFFPVTDHSRADLKRVERIIGPPVGLFGSDLRMYASKKLFQPGLQRSTLTDV